MLRLFYNTCNTCILIFLLEWWIKSLPSFELRESIFIKRINELKMISKLKDIKIMLINNTILNYYVKCCLNWSLLSKENMIIQLSINKCMLFAYNCHLSIMNCITFIICQGCPYHLVQPKCLTKLIVKAITVVMFNVTC